MAPSAKRVGCILVALAMSVGPAGAAPDVVAIVSTRSEIVSLTRSEVADIFLGRVGRLPGGGKVIPLDQPEGSAARDAFYARFAGRTAAQIKAHWSRIIFTGRGQPPAEVPSSQEARNRVAADANAIAYVERALVDDSVRIVSQ
jgi:ABC-type phosphate transport system substrate-binding protein